MPARRGEFLTVLAALGAGALGGSAVAAQPAKPRRFDFHYHLGDPKYIEAIRAHNLPAPPALMTTEKALEDMDKAGVTTSILSIPGPGVWFGDAAEARRLARQCNEYSAQLVADHPKRFGFFATLPLPDVEGALREIAYGLDTLGADGVCTWTSYGNKWLGDPAFAPVFDELNRRKALIYTQPIRADCCAKILPEVPSAVVEYGTDTTRTIASLVFNGVATRCADMRIIFSHDGGTMPFLIERFLFEARNPKTAQKLPHGVLSDCASSTTRPRKRSMRRRWRRC